MSNDGLISFECLHSIFSQFQLNVLQGGCASEQLEPMMHVMLSFISLAISKEALQDCPQAKMSPVVCSMWKDSEVCLSAIVPRLKWTFSMHWVPSSFFSHAEKISIFSWRLTV